MHGVKRDHDTKPQNWRDLDRPTQYYEKVRSFFFFIWVSSMVLTKKINNFSHVEVTNNFHKPTNLLVERGEISAEMIMKF